MHTIKATRREGDHLNFMRGVALKLPDGRVLAFGIQMVTELRTVNRGRRMVRSGIVRNVDDEILWEGEIAHDDPPFHAFMRTVGFCDENGDGTTELPAWALRGLLSAEK